MSTEKRLPVDRAGNRIIESRLPVSDMPAPDVILDQISTGTTPIRKTNNQKTER